MGAPHRSGISLVYLKGSVVSVNVYMPCLGVHGMLGAFPSSPTVIPTVVPCDALVCLRCMTRKRRQKLD